MEDSEFAATVRHMTGKETNTEALATLRRGVGLALVEPEPAVAQPDVATGTTGHFVDPDKFPEN